MKKKIKENTYKFIPSGVISLLTVNKKRYPELYSKISKYFDIFLISFGSEIVPLRQFMEKNRNSSREKFIEALEKIESKFESYIQTLNENERLYIDSGGFQLSFKGFLEFVYRDYPVKYYPSIHKLSEHPKLDTAFYLDIPESRDDTYKTFKEDNMYSFNMYLDYLKNYKKPFNDKMAFIIQFNSPERLELWNYFLDNVVPHKPKKYAVGGLVASRSSLYTNHPVVHWSTGLLMLLNKMVEHDCLYSDIHFHLLGVTTVYYVVSSFIIMEYLKHKSGIRMDVTYDGKSTVDNFVRGRTFIIFDDNDKMIKTYSVMSKDLKKKLHNGRTIEQEVLYTINSFLESLGSDYRFDKIYDEERDNIVNDFICTTIAYQTHILNDKLQEHYLPLIKENMNKIEKRDYSFILNIYRKLLVGESEQGLIRLMKQTLNSLNYIDRILNGEKPDLFNIFYHNSKLDKLCLK